MSLCEFTIIITIFSNGKADVQLKGVVKNKKHLKIKR